MISNPFCPGATSNHGLFAEVAIFSAIEKTLHYEVPVSLKEKVRIGSRVIAPLGRHEAMGLVVGLSSTQADLPVGITVRRIVATVDAHPVLSPDLIELCRWIAHYYTYPLGEVIQTVIPTGMERPPKPLVRLTGHGVDILKAGHASKLLLRLHQHGEGGGAWKDLKKAKIRQEELDQLESEGLIERFFELRPASPPSKKIKYIRLVEPPASTAMPGNDHADRLIELLRLNGGTLPMRRLRGEVHNVDYWIRKLQRQGIITIDEQESVQEVSHAQDVPITAPPPPTAAQQHVLEAILPSIRASGFEPFVLFGVTGSGKTEVYLHLVKEALQQQKGSLILVPEIALSSQMEALFRQRFGSQLAVWHSGLSAATRAYQWQEILSGRRLVVLGVRSAVFAPVCNLGLIIVDEEHDHSYKQDDRLRYHARDVALMRARMRRTPIVLGSATPSLQSVHHCQTRRYQLLSLPSRVHDRPFPALEIVDMRRESSRCRVLSRSLQEALSETVQSGYQALLFLNRRGFATFLLCHGCGHVLECASCSVSLTYHQAEDRMLCHYCGYQCRVPERCPACGHLALVPHGFGTERVEEEVKRLLPQGTVVRLDRDTVSHGLRMVERLNAIRRGQADVLLGTQMIAKGHDFPNITLVGVINADISLQLSDFRAGETTVQLLMQVAGRAGRGEQPGRVILQTYNPAHYAIESILKMDYLDFCRTELQSRALLQYPPFTRFSKVLVTGQNEELTQRAACQLADLCRDTAQRFYESGRHVAVLGPSPAPLAKLNNRYRWHLFVKAWTSQVMQQFIEMVLYTARDHSVLRRVHLTIDRDPTSNL